MLWLQEESQFLLVLFSESLQLYHRDGNPMMSERSGWFLLWLSDVVQGPCCVLHRKGKPICRLNTGGPLVCIMHWLSHHNAMLGQGSTRGTRTKIGPQQTASDMPRSPGNPSQSDPAAQAQGCRGSCSRHLRSDQTLGCRLSFGDFALEFTG